MGPIGNLSIYDAIFADAASHGCPIIAALDHNAEPSVLEKALPLRSQGVCCWYDPFHDTYESHSASSKID